MKKLFLLLLIAFSFIGCDSSEEENIYDYIGTWSGTYDGSEKGTWSFVVASDGKITGTMHSEPTNENYNISGNLDTSGQLNAVIGLPSDGEFTGTLTIDKKGNGTWRNSVPTPDRSGSWTGEKE
ncbi:hypothetical protein HNP38_000725 [Chryseobacterium defluvii]|uniref:Uncharacterized protein n=1 Tax=Chryseobacterium defluvii TaxID=160396 RepID=A0A840KD34_9FLAO|nr:hypothetical protein [Chryseobacterium defluvii]MBB4805453.1 hypothetical protein [Chryseobacterium defluvii]